MSNLNSYKIEKDFIRENLNKYTIIAFKMIPKQRNPHILDVGCGSGVPSIELAKISGGYVIGTDIDVASLNLFRKKIKKERLEERVSGIKKSILNMNFPNESFDIIWAEGSVFVIGFENSIMKWCRFLKSNGFLVIHDEIEDKKNKLCLIPNHGYRLINQFELSENIWWCEYFSPLERLIQKYRTKYPDDSMLNTELMKDQNEIDRARSNSTIISSFFVIMQKI